MAHSSNSVWRSGTATHTPYERRWLRAEGASEAYLVRRLDGGRESQQSTEGLVVVGVRRNPEGSAALLVAWQQQQRQRH